MAPNRKRRNPTPKKLAEAAAAAAARPIDPAEWLALARQELDDAVDLLRARRAGLTDAVRFAVLEKGWPWSDVAQALGVSKQAAHERFAAALRQGEGEDLADDDPGPHRTAPLRIDRGQLSELTPGVRRLLADSVRPAKVDPSAP